MTKSWCWVGIMNSSQARVHRNICMQHYLHTFSGFNCNLPSKNKHPASQTHAIWMFSFYFRLLSVCFKTQPPGLPAFLLTAAPFIIIIVETPGWQIAAVTILPKISRVCRDCIPNIYSQSHLFQLFRCTKPSCPQTDEEAQNKAQLVALWAADAKQLPNFILARKTFC